MPAYGGRRSREQRRLSAAVEDSRAREEARRQAARDLNAMLGGGGGVVDAEGLNEHLASGALRPQQRLVLPVTASADSMLSSDRTSLPHGFGIRGTAPGMGDTKRLYREAALAKYANERDEATREAAVKEAEERRKHLHEMNKLTFQEGSQNARAAQREAGRNLRAGGLFIDPETGEVRGQPEKPRSAADRKTDEEYASEKERLARETRYLGDQRRYFGDDEELREQIEDDPSAKWTKRMERERQARKDEEDRVERERKIAREAEEDKRKADERIAKAAEEAEKKRIKDAEDEEKAAARVRTDLEQAERVARSEVDAILNNPLHPLYPEMKQLSVDNPKEFEARREKMIAERVTAINARYKAAVEEAQKKAREVREAQRKSGKGAAGGLGYSGPTVPAPLRRGGAGNGPLSRGGMIQPPAPGTIPGSGLGLSYSPGVGEQYPPSPSAGQAERWARMERIAALQAGRAPNADARGVLSPIGPQQITGEMSPEPVITTKTGVQTTPTALAVDVLKRMPPPARARELQRMQAAPDEYKRRGIKLEEVIASFALRQ